MNKNIIDKCLKYKQLKSIIKEEKDKLQILEEDFDNIFFSDFKTIGVYTNAKYVFAILINDPDNVIWKQKVVFGGYKYIKWDKDSLIRDWQKIINKFLKIELIEKIGQGSYKLKKQVKQILCEEK